MAFYLDEDTRSDTTRQGYHEGRVPFGAGYGPASDSPLALYTVVSKHFDQTNPESPYYSPGLITGTAPIPALAGKALLAENAAKSINSLTASPNSKLYKYYLDNKLLPLEESIMIKPFTRRRKAAEILPKEKKVVVLKEGVTGRQMQKGLTKEQKAENYNWVRSELRDEDLYYRTASRNSDWKNNLEKAWANGDMRHANSGRPRIPVKDVLANRKNYSRSAQKEIAMWELKIAKGIKGAKQGLTACAKRIVEREGHRF